MVIGTGLLIILDLKQHVGRVGSSQIKSVSAKDKDNSKRVKDKESGVARGIDFQFVANVINFDFPSEPDSYIHR